MIISCWYRDWIHCTMTCSKRIIATTDTKEKARCSKPLSVMPSNLVFSFEVDPQLQPNIVSISTWHLWVHNPPPSSHPLWRNQSQISVPNLSKQVLSFHRLQYAGRDYSQSKQVIAYSLSFHWLQNFGKDQSQISGSWYSRREARHNMLWSPESHFHKADEYCIIHGRTL